MQPYIYYSIWHKVRYGTEWDLLLIANTVMHDLILRVILDRFAHVKYNNRWPTENRNTARSTHFETNDGEVR